MVLSYMCVCRAKQSEISWCCITTNIQILQYFFMVLSVINFHNIQIKIENHNTIFSLQGNLCWLCLIFYNFLCICKFFKFWLFKHSDRLFKHQRSLSQSLAICIHVYIEKQREVCSQNIFFYQTMCSGVFCQLKTSEARKCLKTIPGAILMSRLTSLESILLQKANAKRKVRFFRGISLLSLHMILDLMD